MASTEGVEIRIFCHDEEVVKWWRREPKGSRSASFIKILRRGVGASDEHLEALVAVSDAQNFRISELEAMLPAMAHAMNRFNEALESAREEIEGLSSCKNMALELLERVELLEARGSDCELQQVH